MRLRSATQAIEAGPVCMRRAAHGLEVAARRGELLPRAQGDRLGRCRRTSVTRPAATATQVVPAGRIGSRCGIRPARRSPPRGCAVSTSTRWPARSSRTRSCRLPWVGGDAGGVVVEFGKRRMAVCPSSRSAAEPMYSSARALRSVQRRSPVVMGRLGCASNQLSSPAGAKLTVPCWKLRRATRPGRVLLGAGRRGRRSSSARPSSHRPRGRKAWKWRVGSWRCSLILGTMRKRCVCNARESAAAVTACPLLGEARVQSATGCKEDTHEKAEKRMPHERRAPGTIA